MATLLALPREIRQDILTNVIGEELVITLSSATVLSLLQICRTLREDTQWILSNCTHYFRRPSRFRKLFLSSTVSNPVSEPIPKPKSQCPTWLWKLRNIVTVKFFRRRLSIPSPGKKPSSSKYDLLGYQPNLTSITLRIFNNYSLGDLHKELVRPWIDVLPLLPPDVKEIKLDITPAPISMWRKYPDWAHNFIQDNLHDKRIVRKFIPGHRRVLDYLVEQIHTINPQIVVKFTGLLSVKSREQIEKWMRESRSLGIDYVGEYLPVIEKKSKPRRECKLQELSNRSFPEDVPALGPYLHEPRLARDLGSWSAYNDSESL